MSGEELFRPRNEFGGEGVAACGCTPGTPENGWHETRSEACQEAERHEWVHLFATADSMIDGIRNVRGEGMSGQELVDELRELRDNLSAHEVATLDRAADRIEALEAELAKTTTLISQLIHMGNDRADERDAERAHMQSLAKWAGVPESTASVEIAAEVSTRIEALEAAVDTWTEMAARRHRALAEAEARAERAEQKSAELAAVIAEAREALEHVMHPASTRCYVCKAEGILSAAPADVLSAYTTRVREEAGVKADRLDSLVRWVDHTLTLPIYQNPRKGSEAETVAAEYRHWRRLLTNGLHPSALAKLAEAGPWSEIPEGQNNAH